MRDDACAYFRTGSFAAGITLVDAIGRPSEPEVALARQLTAAAAELDVPVDPAVALAAGGHVVSDENAPGWWTLADAEGNEVDVASWPDRD